MPFSGKTSARTNPSHKTLVKALQRIAYCRQMLRGEGMTDQTKSYSNSDETPVDTASGRSFILAGQRVTAPPLEAALYVVSTPIGNLADITLRALQSLAAADLIACEDTRTSRKLLRHYGIDRKLVACHDHNEAQVAERIVSAISNGQAIALISDAGTPTVSDPGFKVARAVREAGLRIIPIPGASAVLAGLVASGLPSDRFAFAGFLPRKAGALAAALQSDVDNLAGMTIVYYESPKRVLVSLNAISTAFGTDAAITIARELTKLHETILTGTASELRERFDKGETLRGEVVLLVHAPEKKMKHHSPDEVDELLKELLADYPASKAAAQAAKQTGLPRNELYDRASQLKLST
jgi:16S rRNA (cytidine1402-2'-O)-methyltransferase